MLQSLKRLFEAPEDDTAGEAGLHLACAVLLFEVAKADHQLDAKELARLEAVLRGLWQLPDKDLNDLLAVSERQADLNASLHQQVELINANFSQARKSDFLLGLWQVACADGAVHHHEEHLIRRVADLLYLPHQEFIRCKHIALEAQ